LEGSFRIRPAALPDLCSLRTSPRRSLGGPDGTGGFVGTVDGVKGTDAGIKKRATWISGPFLLSAPYKVGPITDLIGQNVRDLSGLVARLAFVTRRAVTVVAIITGLVAGLAFVTQKSRSYARGDSLLERLDLQPYPLVFHGAPSVRSWRPQSSEMFERFPPRRPFISALEVSIRKVVELYTLRISILQIFFENGWRQPGDHHFFQDEGGRSRPPAISSFQRR
jgi:hypothetical protein